MDKPTDNRTASVSLTINPQKQNLDTVHRLVGEMLKRGGCDGCGRIAFLDLHFVGDPGPDLGKVGVISLDIRTR